MMKSPVEYYHDEDLTKRVEVNETGDPIVNWGESIPGKEKKVELYVKNLSKDRIVLRQPTTSTEELKIEDYPTNLMAEEKGKVVLAFKANDESIDAHKGTWGFNISVG